MKPICVLLIITILFACNEVKQTENNLDWLVGNWERTNDSEDQQTHEYWKKANEEEYVGMGVTLMGGDTVFKENIRMIRKEGKWFFEVTGVNESPTMFEVTILHSNSFVAENKQNPFPKRIEYQKKGEILNAFVSAEETIIEFNFQSKE